MKTKERLEKALRDAGAPRPMVEMARSGCYDDIESQYTFPIRLLVEHAKSAGLTDIMERAKAGEFDATPEEWNR